MNTVIETQKLTRRFGQTAAVDGLDLQVGEGEIFGFLGPNGAGKTTTIRMLMNFIRPTRGKASILGRELRWGDYSYRKDIGFLPGDLYLPRHYSGEVFLKYWGELSGRKAVLQERCVQVLALESSDLRKKIQEYSSGMRQKLGITAALQHHPRLIILDEPTGGLDPLVKHSFLELLKELKESGSTIFFSSHILSEVEQVADRTAIIRRGKLAAEGKIEQLKHRGQKRVSIVFRTLEARDKFAGRYECKTQNRDLKVQMLTSGEISVLLKALEGIEIVDINIVEPTLEDIFLQYYNDR